MKPEDINKIALGNVVEVDAIVQKMVKQLHALHESDVAGIKTAQQNAERLTKLTGQLVSDFKLPNYENVPLSEPPMPEPMSDRQLILAVQRMRNLSNQDFAELLRSIVIEVEKRR
jgi:hypothetical protein